MGIDFSKLTGKLLELAKIADLKTGTPNNTYLEDKYEISLFLKEADAAIKSGEITEESVSELLGFKRETKLIPLRVPEREENAKKFYVNNLTDEQKRDVTNNTRINSDNEFFEMAHNLDTMLIENDVTGIEITSNRLPVYDFEKFIEKYLTKQEKFNDADANIKNWFKAPDEQMNTESKRLFEEKCEQILGMPYEEYAEQYSSELEAIKDIPPIIRGYSSIATIKEHEAALKNLSANELAVFRKIEELNNEIYREFRSWENDMVLEANNNVYEMQIDMIYSMMTVEMNEFAYNYNGSIQGFEMPENWLIKKHFLEQIENIQANGIESIENDKSQNVNVKKVLKNGTITIENNNHVFDTKGMQHK